MSVMSSRCQEQFLLTVTRPLHYPPLSLTFPLLLRLDNDIFLGFFYRLPSYIFFSMGVPFSRPIFLLTGDLYPGYQTFKALETNNTDEMKQWLAYWIVRGTIRGAEWFGGAVKNVVPMYTWLKLMMFAWLVHPKYRGALQCYNSLVRPYLLRHENDIDAATEKLTTEVTTRVRSVSKNAVDWLNVKKATLGNQLVAEIQKAAVESLNRNKDQTQQPQTPRNNNHDEPVLVVD